METTTTEPKRRSRAKAKKTTGTTRKTLNDARGFADPLCRYGELPVNHLCGLYSAIQGLPAHSVYALNRLTGLIQEAEGLPLTRKLMIRPNYQWRHGYNHPTIYRKTPGTNLLLASMKLYDSVTLSLANTTQIVQVPDSEDIEPSQHDSSLAVITSSLEICARRSSLIKSYKSHLDILSIASERAQQADSPLSIPIPKIEHKFLVPSADPKARPVYITKSLENLHVKPDSLFAFEYAVPKWNFFVIEYDRSTEDVEPTRDIKRASWLRKDLSYSAISKHPNPIYRSYLNIGNLLVLCLFHDARRMRHVMALTKQYATYPDQFLFMTIPYVDHLVDPPIMTCLFEGDWLRPDGSTFNISTLKEGR
jgi:hypothetical protein